MAITTKKLKQGINPRDFINKVYHLTKKFQTVKGKYDSEINLLAKKFLSTNCAFKVGDVINIKDSTEGFTSFKVATIVPDINWEKRTLRLKAYGVMSGEGKVNAEKMIWLDELKKAGPDIEMDTAVVHGKMIEKSEAL